jgi:hypothetical protein
MQVFGKRNGEVKGNNHWYEGIVEALHRQAGEEEVLVDVRYKQDNVLEEGMLLKFVRRYEGDDLPQGLPVPSLHSVRSEEQPDIAGGGSSADGRKKPRLSDTVREAGDAPALTCDSDHSGSDSDRAGDEGCAGIGDAELWSRAAVRTAQYYKAAMRGDSSVLLDGKKSSVIWHTFRNANPSEGEDAKDAFCVGCTPNFKVRVFKYPERGLRLNV